MHCGKLMGVPSLSFAPTWGLNTLQMRCATCYQAQQRCGRGDGALELLGVLGSDLVDQQISDKPLVSLLWPVVTEGPTWQCQLAAATCRPWSLLGFTRRHKQLSLSILQYRRQRIAAIDATCHFAVT